MAQSMAKEVSPSERILDAAEKTLRRHGAEKTNVVDVARELDMSHGNIYRHFPSKKALLDAVAARWMAAVMTPLDAIADDHARLAAERLTSWFDTLRKAKRRKLLDDPELFRVYFYLAKNSPDLVDEHLRAMLSQLERIITDGVASGEFPLKIEPRAAARAFLQGAANFHHPAMVLQNPPPTEADARAVLKLLLAGLRAGAV
jgi:AcrR family transcriptional regulator